MNNIKKRIKKPKKADIKVDNRTIKRKVGDIGESVACDYLLKLGFKIVGRNYLKPYGEIDIVAEKGGIYHFVEVKSVTHVTKGEVSRITDSYRPEDNMHGLKLKRLSNAIQAYILENKIFEAEWVVDVITVRLNMETRRAKVEMIKDIVL
jgi:putative endonuclease